MLPLSSYSLLHLLNLMASAAALSFAILTASTVLALRRARDASTAAFVAAAYVILLLLLRSVRALGRLPPGADGAARGRLKLRTWVLATALNALFSYQVAGVMPPLVAVTVWTTSAITTSAVFFIFFLHDNNRA